MVSARGKTRRPLAVEGGRAFAIVRAMDSADYREGAAAFTASGRRISSGADHRKQLKAGEPG